MKKMKTLALLFLAVIMSSTGLVSCIDEDIDPAVAAIYQNQAALLAASAGVQNAQATLLVAQAAAEQAKAALSLANAELISANADNIDAETADLIAETAWWVKEQEQELLLLVAQTATAVDSIEDQLARQQALFQAELLGLMDDLNEAGAIIAAEHASSYDGLMSNVLTLMGTKQTNDNLMNELSLMINSLYEDYAMTQLEMNVAAATSEIASAQAAYAALLAVIEDPTSIAAQVSEWQDKMDTAEALAISLEIEAETLYSEADELIDGQDGIDEARKDFVQIYEDHQNDTITWNGDITAELTIITNNGAAITNYAGALLVLQGLVTDANAAVLQSGLDITTASTAVSTAQLALGVIGITFPDYYTVDSNGGAIDAVGVKYANPANLQQVLVNAKIDAAVKTAAHGLLVTNHGNLVATYNAAAAALDCCTG